MKGRTYCNKEIMQWGYVALVCVALGLTTMTGATASIKGSTATPNEGPWNVCSTSHALGEIPDKNVCEVKTGLSDAEPKGPFWGATILNSSFTGNSPLIDPTHEKHAN